MCESFVFLLAQVRGPGGVRAPNICRLQGSRHFAFCCTSLTGIEQESFWPFFTRDLTCARNAPSERLASHTEIAFTQGAGDVT
jgi:hypothetical protein